MKKANLFVIGLVLVLPAMLQAQPAPQYGVAGSVHDFSQETWASWGSVCSPCHAAHHTDPAQLIPLWIHGTSTGPFTPYTSDTLDAAIGNPSGASLACLSCHDGTVAINQLHDGTIQGGVAVTIDPSAQIGPDLHTTHPISFTYDPGLAAADGALVDPTVYQIGDAHWPGQPPPVPASFPPLGNVLTGKTIQEGLMDGGTTMECSTCHDVHKIDGSAPTSGILLKISGSDSTGRGSLICRNCHLK